jgi:hypothetical protein
MPIGFTPQQQRGEPTRRHRRSGNSLLDTIRYKATREDRPRFFNVLDIMASFPQGLAGLTANEIQRERGAYATGPWKAFKKGMRESKSFAEVTGSFGSGIMLDIATDIPGWVIPAKGFAVVRAIPGAKVVGRGIKSGAHIVSESADKIHNVRRAREAMGEVFQRAHRFKKYNPEMRDEFQDNLHKMWQAETEAGENIAREIGKLGDEVEIREVLFLWDEKPKFTTGVGDPRLIEWQEAYAALTDNQKMMMRVVASHIKSLEPGKVASGQLTYKALRDFEIRNQREYVPHRYGGKAQRLDELEEVQEGLINEEAWAQDFMDAGADLKDLQKWVSFFEDVPADDAFDDLIDAFYLKKIEARRKMPFALRRADLRTLREKVEAGNEGLITDLQELMRVESRDVAVANAARKWQSSLLGYAKKQGLIIPKSLVDRPTVLKQYLVKQIGKKATDKRLRDGFAPIHKQFAKDLMVPKSLAEEFNATLDLVSNKEKLVGLHLAAVTMTHFFKAWTLGPFMDYWSRNSATNNILLMGKGMNFLDPRTLEDKMMAARLVLRWNSGHGIRESYPGKKWIGDILRKNEKAVRGEQTIHGYTEPQLYREFKRRAVLTGGEAEGEYGMIFRNSVEHKNQILRFIDHRTNPVLRWSFRKGRMIEDTDRVHAALWRLRKGESMEEAAKFANDTLYDYKFGLSKFEDKYLRNMAIPFYAWIKFNLPAQTKLFLRRPQFITGQYKVLNALETEYGGPDPGEVALAKWERTGVGVRMGYDKKTGQYTRYGLDSWIPMSDLRLFFDGNAAGREFINMLNPYAKIPIEILTHYNTFTKEKLPKFKGEKGYFMGVPLDVRLTHMMNTWRGFKRVDNLIKTKFRPDPRDSRTTWQKYKTLITSWTVGIRGYPRDPARQRKFWRQRTEKQIGYLKYKRKDYIRRSDKANAKAVEKEIERLQKQLKGK